MTSYLNREPRTLSSSHKRMLFEESAIDPSVVEERGYHTARRRSDIPEAFKGYQRKVGLVIPVCSPDGTSRSWQLRPNKPRKDKKGKPLKYETPGGSAVILDVHPRMRGEVRSGSGDLWITEGIKKADALTSRGLPTIGLIGVWTWQKDGDLLPCWEHVSLKGRRAYVVFDSDVMDKEGVQLALERLVRALEDRSAEVLVIYLPEELSAMPKIGVDDFLAAGHSVAELKTLARKFEPADVGRIRLSRDQKLRAAMSDLWQTWRDYDWMHLIGTARRGNWQRGHTVRDVLESLLELAERRGKLDEHGVVVSASHRLLVEMSAKSRPSVRVALKHAEAEGMLEVLEAESEGKARRYRLLVPRAAFYHKGEGVTDEGEVTSLVHGFDPGGKGLRAPTASRLRWSSPARKVRRLRGVTPGTRRVRQTQRFHKDITVKESRIRFPDTPYVKRLGPHRCAVLDTLEAAGGTLTLRELCEVLHRNRTRDVRRRILPMLEEAGIIEVEGDVIRLAADWLARLEEERERKGEISHAEEQREKHREQRERYRDYLRAVKRQPSQAGREVIERGRELRYTHLRGQPPPDQPSEAAPSPLAEAVRDYLDRHPRQARQPAGWIGVTLWAEGLHPKLEDPPAQTRAAIGELGGAAYLDAKLKEAKGAA